MTTRRLTTSLSETEVRQLSISDEVYLDGLIYTCRSQFQIRALEQDILPPLDFRELNVMFHMGGIMRKVAGRWEAFSLLATSSYRFDKLTPSIVKKLGVRAIIGKGTMGGRVVAAMKEEGCVHLSWGAVIGNVLAGGVRSVQGVYGLDELGPVEATWVLEVEKFGPFVVDIDAHGNNLFSEVRTRVDTRLASVFREYDITGFEYT